MKVNRHRKNPAATGFSSSWASCVSLLSFYSCFIFLCGDVVEFLFLFVLLPSVVCVGERVVVAWRCLCVKQVRDDTGTGVQQTVVIVKN